MIFVRSVVVQFEFPTGSARLGSGGDLGMKNEEEWPEGIEAISEQCKECGEVFEARRSEWKDITEARKHLKLRVGAHHSKTREDFSQAAARIVREATKD
jgi:hypothetical protein